MPRPDPSSLDVRVLGGLEVSRSGERVEVGRGGRRTVLSVLALAEGATVPTRILLEEIWGEDPPGNARTIVHGHVSKLRRIVGDPDGAAIATKEDGYALGLPPAALDIAEFRGAVARGEAAAAGSRWSETLEALDLATEIWRGEPAAGIPLEGPSRSAVRALEALHSRVQILRVDALLQLGEHERVVPELERLAAEHPFDERLHGRLALAQYQSGRQHDALATIRTIRGRLREELGVDPRSELVEIEEAILRHDAGLRPERSAAVLRRSHFRWIAAARIRITPRDDGAPIADTLAGVEATVRRHGGEATALPGEGVLGVWGLHDPEPDVATRAVRAACEIMAADTGATTGLAVAVATGKALALESDPARSMQDADAVFSAASLVRAAGSGEILLDAVTADLLDRSFARRPRDRAWVLEGNSDAIAPASIHGRGAELAVLHDTLEACARTSSSRCVLVTGPGGIGKSTLAQAFVAQERVARRVEVTCGREPVGSVLGRLITAVGASGTHEDAPVEERFLAARAALAVASDGRPLLIVLEDLHQLGDEAVAVLARLVRSLRDRPVCVVCSSREIEPELATCEPIHLPLAPLTEPDARAMLDGLLPDPPNDATLERILLVAHGNPLFLRQSAALGGVADGAAIPASVDLVLHTRLQAVPRHERLVLEHLAVLELSRDSHLLIELMPEHLREDLPGLLDSLRRHGWLDAREPRLAHELLSDAAYAEMNGTARARAHLMVAKALERGREEGPDAGRALGTHLERFVESADPSDERVAWARAGASSHLATEARRLLRAGDATVATDLLRRATGLRGRDTAEGIGLAIEYLQAIVDAGRIEDATRTIHELSPVVDEHADTVTTCYFRVVVASYRLWAGPSSDERVSVRREVEDVIPTLTTADHLAGRELASYLLAWLDYHRGNLTSADERMVEVAELRRRLGRTEPSFIPSRLLDGAATLDDDTLARMTDSLEDVTGSWRAERLAQLGGLFALRGDGVRADDLIATACGIADALQLPATTGAVETEAGTAALRLGRNAEAAERLRRAERAFAGTGDGNYRSTALAQLARTLVRVGDTAGSLEASALATSLAGEDDVLTGIVSGAARGLAIASDGDPRGVGLVEDAVRLAETTELHVPWCDSMVDLAASQAASGHPEDAAACAKRAIDGYELKHAAGAARSVREAFLGGR